MSYASERLSLEARIKSLNTVLTEKHDRQTVDAALRAVNGDMPNASVCRMTRNALEDSGNHVIGHNASR